MKGRLAVITCLALLAIQCTDLLESIKNGELLPRDFSLFTRYASQYCRLTSSDGTESLSLDCEHLRDFRFADDAACRKDNGFLPAFAYFPDRVAPMKLCRDFDVPGRSEQNTIRFIAFGDNGAGDDVVLGYSQSAVSKAMASVCPHGVAVQDEKAARACDFATILGDVIYPRGITDVWDSRLGSRFEEIYAATGTLPIYVFPGNHDYDGNVTAMIEYSWFSDRWRMPARHYPISDLPPWLHLYGLDSNGATGDNASDTSAEQLAAIKSNLCGKDGWRILLGHFPPFSNGEHGSHEAQGHFLKELYASCPFHIYMGGHDHHQEHISAKEYDIVIQGAGGANVRDVAHAPDISDRADIGLSAIIQRYAKRAHGFAVVEATKEAIDLYFFDIGVWNYANGAFQKTPRFEDYSYHCRMTAESSGCLPQ